MFFQCYVTNTYVCMKERLNVIILSHFLTVCSYSTPIRDIGPKESPYRLADKKNPSQDTNNEKRMTYHYLVTGGLFNLIDFVSENNSLLITYILQLFMLVDYVLLNIPFVHCVNTWAQLEMHLLWDLLKLNWIIFRKENL